MQNLTETPKRFSTLPTMEKLAIMRQWLEEHKALDIVSLNLAGTGAFAEAMLVVSATSVRHGQSLADGIGALCREHNFEYLRMEGYNPGQWILVDCNDIIVHVFQTATRETYQLEQLWSSYAAAHAQPAKEA